MGHTSFWSVLMLIVLDKNLNIINKNTDILLDSNKEVGLEVKHRENQVYVSVLSP